ncbi:hypothetical protein [uncultured Pseudodesulfovibrio sp.]|uniref:hypothetical protein n=1 Tax=uncultured Pseudodesulfovibrio sp. TaxID=2035858 RepID=UPI0029C7F213|nr:hypothetical protein [uncultured Pseudodesulfovibrio sp.]
MTTLLAATSDYVGEWSRAVLAHVLLVGGFGAIWIGTQLFFGKRIVHWYLVIFGLSLVALGVFFYWYWIVNPAYQFRLAMGCVLLLLLSLGISQTFFAYRVGQGAVTAAGVFYSIFGFINGLRTVHIILFPDSHAYFLSGVIAKTLTSLMIPVLIAAMISQLAILRQENRFSDESDE